MIQSITIKSLLCFLFLTISFAHFGQTTTQNGSWNNVATWGGNPVPDFNSGAITINHNVTINAADYPISTPLQVDQLTVNAIGTLTVSTGAAMRVRQGNGTDLTVNGSLTVQSGAELLADNGVTYSGGGTTFNAGAVHRTASVNIPTAAGYGGIDVYIEGVTGALTLANSWNQLTATTDLIVNCPDLGNSLINFSGQITNLNSLQLLDTDGTTGGRVSVNSTGVSALTIVNGLTVQDDSRLLLTNSGIVTLNLTTGGLTFSPSGSAQYSHNASTGTGTINFNGNNFNMTNGLWRMVGSGNGGTGVFNFNNSSNMQVSGGVISENGTGAALGTISFNGAVGNQTLNWIPSAIGSGTINLVINKALGNVVQTNNLTIERLTLTNGNLALSGNPLTVTGDLSATVGRIDATTASSFSITGTGALPATIPFSAASVLSNFTLDRTGAVVSMSGVFMANTGLIDITDGTISTAIPALGVYDILYQNTGAYSTGAEIPVSSTVLRNLTKQGGGTLTLASNVTINGNLTLSAGTFAASTFNVSLVGDYVANANFTVDALSGSTFTFLTRTPTNTHSISGTATNTSFRHLIINGDLTVSKNIRVFGNFTVQASSSFLATAGTSSFRGTTAMVNNGTGISFFTLSITNGNSMTAPPNGTIHVARNFSGNGTFNHNNSTVIFNGTSTLTGSIKIFFNATVNNGSTLSGARSWEIVNNLVNNGTINFTAQTLTWNSSGTFSGTGAATLFNVTTSAAQTLNLTLANTLTISGNLTLTGNFNQTTTNDVTIAGNLTGNGNLTSTGRIIFTGVAAAMSGTGNKAFTGLRITGTLTVANNTSYSTNNTGAIDIIGTLNTTAGGTSTTTIAGSTTVLNTGVSTTFNNLTITGTLNATGTIQLNNNFTNNGTFDHGFGIIRFNNTGAATKTITGSATVALYDIVVDDNGNATDVANNVSGGALQLNGVLTVNPLAVFDADGSANDRTFVVTSSADDPADDASIGHLLGGAQVSGNFTVQRFVSVESVNRLYRYIAAPVLGQTVADWQDDVFVTGTFTGAQNGATPGCTGCTTNSSSFFFDEATQAYVAYPAANSSNTDPLVSGRGYAVFFRQNLTGNVTVDHRGTHPPTGANISLPVGNNVNDYSLVGNPYPAPLLWSATGWSKTSVSDIIAIRDNASGGIFQYFDINDGDGIIATGQAFWAQTTGAGPVLQVNESAKTSTQLLGGAFYKVNESIKNELVVKLTKTTNNITNGLTDKAVLRLLPGTLENRDGRDATKADNAIATKGNTEANVSVQLHDLSIKSADNFKMAINSVPSINCNGQVYALDITNFLNPAYNSLAIPAEAQVQYTMAIEPAGSLKGLTWVLHDNYTNTDINLSNTPTYQFTTFSNIAASRAADRFYLTGSSNVVLNTALTLSTPMPSICEGTEAIVKVHNSQPGVVYAYEINGQIHPYSEEGNGATLSMFIDSEDLTEGINTIRIKGNSACEQEFLAESVQVVKQNKPIANVTPANRCSAGSVKLIATGSPTEQYVWYSDNEGTIVAEGKEFITPHLSDTTTYYVSALNELGCEGEIIPVNVFVGGYDVDLEIEQLVETICKNESVLLSAQGAPEGSQYRWYTSADAQTPVSESTVFATPQLSQNTSYYVAALNEAGCESPRIEHIVEVMDYTPVISIVQRQAVCYEGEAQLTIQEPTESEYRWYSTIDDVAPSFIGNEFTTPKLKESKEFYAEAISAHGCVSERHPFSTIVNTKDISKEIVVSSANVCMGSEGLLSVSAENAVNYLWYYTKEDIMPIGEGATFTSPVELVQSTVFYVAAVSQEGCTGTRVEAEASVTAYEPLRIEQTSGLELTANYKTNLQWFYDGVLIAGATQPTIQINKSGVYGLMANITGCEAYTEKEFLVTGVEGSLGDQIIVYPNPASEMIYIENQGKNQVNIVMMDTRGKELDRFLLDAPGKKIIELKDVEKGIYLMKIILNEHVVTKKIIVR